MWFILGCSSISSTLLFNTDLLYLMLASVATLSFFTVSFLFWKMQR